MLMHYSCCHGRLAGLLRGCCTLHEHLGVRNTTLPGAATVLERCARAPQAFIALEGCGSNMHLIKEFTTGSACQTAASDSCVWYMSRGASMRRPAACAFAHACESKWSAKQVLFCTCPKKLASAECLLPCQAWPAVWRRAAACTHATRRAMRARSAAQRAARDAALVCWPSAGSTTAKLTASV